MKRAGWRIRETSDTNRFFNSLGAGMVRRKANAASAATTYVNIIHCNAIFASNSSAFACFAVTCSTPPSDFAAALRLKRLNHQVKHIRKEEKYLSPI
ncbi:hypothetical protein EV1_015779 [Malus domestica]